jgi:hypothetical protein
MNFLTNILSKIKMGFVGLGKFAPFLTKAATTVEIITGNEELVPLTEKAGAAAAKIGQELADTDNVVGVVAEALGEVAESEGSTSVAKVAKNVAKAAKK